MNWMNGVFGRFVAGALFAHKTRMGDWRGPSSQSIGLPESNFVWRALGDQKSSVENFSDLVDIYMQSSSYLSLARVTKRNYQVYISRILEKFGSVPLKAFDERGARTVIRRWRDEELASKPRTADATMSVLRRLLSFAVDEEYIDRNPALQLGYLGRGSRRENIWSDKQISQFLTKAPRHMGRVLLLAIWTGQRQGDLLALKWESYDGAYISLQQKKITRHGTGRRVKVLVSSELRAVLDEIRAEQVALSQHPDIGKRVPIPNEILTSSTGRPWSGGFKYAWHKAVAHAGISGVTFHDLRGTFITLSHRARASIRDIAEASGHDETRCESVIRHHYLATGAERVISRLESSKRFDRVQHVTSPAFIADDAFPPSPKPNVTPPHHAELHVDPAMSVPRSPISLNNRFTGPRKRRVAGGAYAFPSSR